MATNEDTSLIGYDPLAWMDQDTEMEVVEDNTVINDILADTGLESSAINQRELSDDSPADAGAVPGMHESVENNDALSDMDNGNNIHLDANLNIQNVLKLHGIIKKTLAEHSIIEVNAAEVTSIDTATLQLLVALKKDAAKQHKEVVINAPSARFIESAELLGLAEILDV